MTRRLLARRHGSIFAKLLVVMVTMALAIPFLLGAFFDFIVDPALRRSLAQVSEQYFDLLAATAPSPERAKELATRLDIDIRYEGPNGSWSTATGLPSIAEARRQMAGAGPAAVPPLGRELYVAERADGAAYLFVWNTHDRLVTAHSRFVLLVSVLLIGVVIVAHTVLRRALRPVRWLRDGAASLREGNLDVVIEPRTNDEFGELTDAFNHMMERVRQMVRSRDQLLLDVSHELRSPLTRMKVALELCPEDEHKRRLAANINDMEALVTELLELERLRNGRGLVIAEHDLVQLARDAVAACAGRPPGVLLESEPATLRLPVDAAKVRRVLDNLLDNALKYSLPDSRPVTVRIERARDSARARVEDDGVGIAQEDLASLFEPFFRGDRSRSRKTGGYGLGLSLCRRIMEALGGTITAERNRDRGATFELRFPYVDSRPSDARWSPP